MRNHISKFLALLLLIGVAQTLTACVFEDDHDRHWHDEHHDDHHWDDHR
jgi:hypothetical protein